MTRALVAAAVALALLSAPASAQSLRSIVSQAAARHRIPAGFAHAIVTVESRYRCGADNGIAQGIGQVRPATARSVGVYGNLHDCRTGAEAMARYLALAIRRAGVSCAGASLYNMGVFARPRCTGYGRQVMSIMRTAGR